MICGKCGNQMPVDTKFCIECGNPMLEQTGVPQQQSHEAIIQSTPELQYTPSLKFESPLSDEPSHRSEQSTTDEPAKHFNQTAAIEQAHQYGSVLQREKTGEPFLRKIAVPALVMIILTLIFTFVVFVLIDTQPGDPALIPLDGAATESDIMQLRSELGLDSPFIIRYARALTGNYGVSYMTRQPIGIMIRERIPTTIKLILAGMIVTLLFSLPLGIASAVRRNRFIDALSAALSMVFKSLPFYIIALVSLLWFSIGLGLLPVAGESTWMSYILPGVALGLPCLGFAIKTIRATALKIVSNGRKGLIFPESGDGAGQLLQDAVLPTISVSGLQLGWLFGGALLIETVFAFPGVGHMLVAGLMSRDTPVVLGAVMSLTYCFLVVALCLVFVVAVIVLALTPKKVRARV